MTTTAPPTEALPTASTAIVISQLEVLLGDIAEAKAQAAWVTFDYDTRHTEMGNALSDEIRAPRNLLRLDLLEALAGKTRLQVADALVAGTFHPAVKIDWSLV